ncbi:FT-interacting protein 1-like [Iris pallida]|uniref:FT-interacting protein 1-like n=1 Tax=Iris pallida TaxID=29817 RepID=A0AAX6E4B3_IRIPA|nr:FT-interacting protein 1-like [Iris pallida]KAJ6819182.1 FT-interacting protein 1-like [Iris pallida]
MFNGTEGSLWRNLGCLNIYRLARKATTRKAVTYRMITSTKQKVTKSAVAQGSLQLNKDCSLSP